MSAGRTASGTATQVQNVWILTVASLRAHFAAWRLSTDSSPETVAAFEAGWRSAVREAEAAVSAEFLEDQSDGHAVTPDDEAYQHAVADCLNAVRELVPTRSDSGS